jgi:hypothetical protein
MLFAEIPMSTPLRKCKVCGFEAFTEDDLKRFVVCSKSKYGHSNFCKNCFSDIESKKNKGLIPRFVKKPYLKKCRICGLEAKTEPELELFVLAKEKKYGRHTICKKCSNNKNKLHRKIDPDYDTRHRRKQELIQGFPKPLRCYWCGEEITKLTGLDSDSLFIHSLDGNHENWNPENKVPCHHKCHSTYHISGDKNPNKILALKRK